jgi:hypothetical protein
LWTTKPLHHSTALAGHSPPPPRNPPPPSRINPTMHSSSWRTQSRCPPFLLAPLPTLTPTHPPTRPHPLKRPLPCPTHPHSWRWLRPSHHCPGQ